MEIVYGEIKMQKNGKKWTATTRVTQPFNSEVNMAGDSEYQAKEKLIRFLTNKPYSDVPLRTIFMKCSKTKKLMLPDLKSAKQKRKAVVYNFHNNVGIYICPFCNHYHLTTR